MQIQGVLNKVGIFLKENFAIALVISGHFAQLSAIFHFKVARFCGNVPKLLKIEVLFLLFFLEYLIFGEFQRLLKCKYRVF